MFEFQAEQGGNVGITLVSLWFMPLTDSPQDKDAVARSLEFMLGWLVIRNENFHN